MVVLMDMMGLGLRLRYIRVVTAGHPNHCVETNENLLSKWRRVQRAGYRGVLELFLNFELLDDRKWFWGLGCCVNFPKTNTVSSLQTTHTTNSVLYIPYRIRKKEKNVECFQSENPSWLQYEARHFFPIGQ